MTQRRIISLPGWPQPDRLSWERAIATGDIFDGQGTAAHWAPASRQVTMLGYGRWIGYLLSLNEANILALAPDERVTPERVDAYIRDISPTLQPSGLWNYIKNLKDAMRAMAPERDWTWLHQIEHRLSRLIPRKHHGNHLPDSQTLLEFGLSLMTDKSAEGTRNPHALRLRYRDGLIIALLSLIPLRRRNISMMRIGTHLQKSPAGWYLVFEESETKNHKPLDFDFPAMLEVHLTDYLQRVRPLIGNAADHDWLWPSYKGNGLSGAALYSNITKHIRSGLGIEVTLHQFRDCAATTLALQNPDSVMLAKDLLGHADFRTTQAHYIRSCSINAGRRFLTCLAKDRDRVTTSASRGPS
tara:strand:+ start:13294 stop:14361 length:1068 start_codon:yes stop_codon:yes gene_type:complete